MNGDGIAKLFEVVRKKGQIDQESNWSKGHATYLAEIKKELVEVEEEIGLGRICYLEDELGDVLWDYLNLLLCLELFSALASSVIVSLRVKNVSKTTTAAAAAARKSCRIIPTGKAELHAGRLCTGAELHS